jgi:hypothetical protein
MSTTRTALFTHEEFNQLSTDEKAIAESYENNDAIVAITFDMSYTDNGPVIDYSMEIDWHYLDQIKDPTHNRGSRASRFYQGWHQGELPDHFYKVNLRTFKMHEHHPGNNRNTKHKDEVRTNTEKWSSTKPPRDPRQMELFNDDEGIGFHWFEHDCKIKREKKTGIVKYVFPENETTDGFFWALPNGTQEEMDTLKQYMQENPLGTLESLIEKNETAIKTKKPIYWNEILIGFPAGKLEAVFATRDVRSHRLRAYRAMLHAKEKLGLTKDPVLYVNQPHYAYNPSFPMPQRKAVFRFYRQAEIEADLKAEALERQAEQSLLDLIQNHRAVALVVPDEKVLHHHLEQLTHVDTPKNRPSLSTEFFKGKVPDVLRKVNLETFEVDNHYHPGQSRAKKPAAYVYPTTVKTEVTLMPTDPEWMDFGAVPGTGVLALLFDYNDCDVKEKYIFQDATKIKLADCAWLNVTDQDVDALKARFKDQPVGDLAAVKARNDQAVRDQKAITPNVLFARLPKCLPKQGVSFRGIACLTDDLPSRLKAWDTMLQIKKKFKLAHDLPIAVMQPPHEPWPDAGFTTSSFRMYRDYEREQDEIESHWEKMNPAGLAKRIKQFYMHSSRLRWQYPMTLDEEKARAEQSRDYVKRLRNDLTIGKHAEHRIAHLNRLAAELEKKQIEDDYVLVGKDEVEVKDDEYVMIEERHYRM